MLARKIALYFSFITTLFIAGCASVPTLQSMTPAVEVTNTRLAGLSMQSANVEALIEIQNKAPINLMTKNLQLDLQVAGQTIADVLLNDPISIEANGSKMVAVPINLPYQALFNAANELKGANEFSFALVGSTAFPIPGFGDARVPLNFEGTLPIPQLPKITLDEVVLSELGVRKTVMDVYIGIENPNIFPLTLTDFNIKMDANDNRLLDVRALQDIQVASGESVRKKFPLTLQIDRAGIMLYQAILGQEPIDWNISGRTDVLGLQGLSVNDLGIDIQEYLSAFK
ncbi:NDR1/HIN1-like protein [Salinibius halmophilus]|uniref:NDR1/HIN1-like protein n=1 Tax=Salinibius halmophilus TaxID=1853216 RepID=UPI000E661657|nr:LEA type 2 family protein [Salinibius halmophilus]